MNDPGVIIVDGVWFYGDNLMSVVFNAGDTVQIHDQVGDTVYISYAGMTGTLLEGVLINLNEPLAEQKLFVFALGYFDEGAFVQAALLFETFIRNFPQSTFYAEALYHHGLTCEQIARVMSPTDSFPGCSYNDDYGIWFYTGESYMDLLEAYPQSEYASKSAYRLFTIMRMRNLPWRDSTELIIGELDMWKDFVERYRESDECVLALLEIGYLNRVLYEITGDSDYKIEAAHIFQDIREQYPDTRYSAQADVHLHELANGDYIYKY
jgi:outer membrane protein assembly factor BamD (BamD/ComL family)